MGVKNHLKTLTFAATLSKTFYADSIHKMKQEIYHQFSVLLDIEIGRNLNIKERKKDIYSCLI